MFFWSLELKYLVLLIFLFSNNSIAQCLDSENLEGFTPKIEFIKGTLNAGDMHLPLDEVLIELPENYNGINLHSLRVTEGEVASFYIPLEFKVIKGLAKSYILGSKSSLKNFELEIVYSKKGCSKFMQIMLLSEH
jgi:hypothetical protein